MYTLLLLSLLCSIVIIIILLVNSNNKKQILEKLNKEKNDLEKLKREELSKYFKEEWKAEQDKLKIRCDSLENEWRHESQKNHMKMDSLKSEVKTYENILAEKEKRYNEVNQDLTLYKKGKIEEIDRIAAEYEQRKQQEIKTNIDDFRASQVQEAKKFCEMLEETKENLTNECREILAELEIERSKRAAINEEILRQRQIEENQDFYRIQLDPLDKNDIEILKDTAARLRHPEAVNKIIWSCYYQKPMTELRKRAAIEDSGVYKITRLKTGEVYLGQSTNVSTRWAEHCKAALGVGTLASSQLHRVMKEDGPEQFTWEVLERVPKENLRERESYYIDFYDSKNYGLNSVVGDRK